MEDNRTLGQQVLAELVAIGFARVTDFLFVEDGKIGLHPTDLLTKDQQAAIASIERTSNGLKIKFYDKLKALELIAKYTGLDEGKSGVQVEENNLLEAVIGGTKEEVDVGDLPEVQQAAADRHDLVEPAGIGGV